MTDTIQVESEDRRVVEAVIDLRLPELCLNPIESSPELAHLRRQVRVDVYRCAPVGEGAIAFRETHDFLFLCIIMQPNDEWSWSCSFFRFWRK